LEEEGCMTILNDFSIFLQRIVTKINKISIVIEEDGSGRFLVIAAIAGIEHFNSNFAILIRMPW
jgi:predicted ATP-binding protein involved in virulence